MRRSLAAILVAVSLAGAAARSLAALPPPAWMPGSPISAGAQVILLWVPIPGAVKYNIYLDGKKVGDSTNVQFMLPSPEEPGEHKITVAGVEASGAEGTHSSPGIVRIVALVPPKELAARVVEGNASLRWDKAPGAVIYNVYRSEKADSGYTLLGSVQSEAYTDSKLPAGKRYFYTVTSKDVSGKESKQSKPLEVSLVEEKKAVTKKVAMKVVPSKEVNRIFFIGKDKPVSYSGWRISPYDGFGYWLDSGRPAILKIDLSSGDVVAKFGEGGAGEGKLQTPTGIDFSRDGSIYVVDLQGKVLIYGKDGAFRKEFKAPVLDPVKDKRVYENGTPTSRGTPISLKSVLVDDEKGLLYVSSQSHNTILVFTLDGNFKEFLGSGAEGKDRFLLPSEMLMTKDRKQLVVAQPMMHYASVFDLGKRENVDLIGERKTGFVGGFIGITGVAQAPNGGLVLADSAVHSIQVFDPVTHDYLFHIGGPEPKADPEFPERAKFDFPYQVGLNFDSKGQFYVVHGIDKFISVRQVEWNKAVEVK